MNLTDSTPHDRRRRFLALRQSLPGLLTGTELAASLASEESFNDEPVEPRHVLADLIKLQRHMRHVNRFVSRENRAALAELGLSPAEIEKLRTPDLAGQLGFPDSALKANARAIRKIRRRIRP